jgi:hypothetical protein
MEARRVAVAVGVGGAGHGAARGAAQPGLQRLGAAVPLAGRDARARLADDQAHARGLLAHGVQHLQHAAGVERHLRVLLGLDLDAAAVLEVDGDDLVGQDDGDVQRAPGLVERHAQVAAVVDLLVDEQHGAGHLHQHVDVVERDLDVAHHVLVAGELEARGVARLDHAAGLVQEQLAAQEVGRGHALLQAPGQDLVRGRALGGVDAGGVGLAGLHGQLAGAQHHGLEA